ncbi:MAG: PEPxxWA-CTERM sorting domain-containing protein, partial [Rhizomicrobium sp.]
MRALIKAAAMALFFGAALAPAHAVVIGTTDTNPNHSNSAPFGSLQASYFYQQVYDDGAFNAPITINELTFYNSITPGGSVVPGAFRIYLASTSQAVMGIVNNIPDLAAATLVFDGALPAVSAGRLDIMLSQSFAYDPSSGSNLLLIVKNFNFSAGAPMFLDSDTTGAITSSRHYSGPNGPSGNLKSGLITGFNDAVAVPEPSTWAMMILGIAGIGFLAMRRRT